MGLCGVFSIIYMILLVRFTAKNPISDVKSVKADLYLFYSDNLESRFSHEAAHLWSLK